MGVCPLSPERRVLEYRNNALKALLQSDLKDMSLYSFAGSITQTARQLAQRYLLNEGTLQDIDKLHMLAKSVLIRKEDHSISDQIEQELKNSCLLLENEVVSDARAPEEEVTDSFENNMKKHQSLVMQINILYSKDIRHQEYSQSLGLFLKWAQQFHEHSFGGLLKPIYKSFCHSIYQLPLQDFTGIVDEICVFVQYMVKIITEIYGLHDLARTEKGKLFKNENIYNLIMSFLFKRTKIKNFILHSIRINFKAKAESFAQRLKLFKGKPITFFGVSHKFTLQPRLEISEGREKAGSSEIEHPLQDPVRMSLPYERSLRLMDDLTRGGSPVTKLKTIVSISKELVFQIKEHYSILQQQAPNVDPDNLVALVMYLIITNQNAELFEELKIVQNFTTSNCLNCISGYYLNTFVSAIEALEELA